MPGRPGPFNAASEYKWLVSVVGVGLVGLSTEAKRMRVVDRSTLSQRVACSFMAFVILTRVPASGAG
jgi:hypothetical protein